jgi:hypothetical protein
VPAVLRLCADRLRELIRDSDQNLKYLGLMGLWSLMRSHPKVVAEHRELVLKCLMDDDITIKMVRAAPCRVVALPSPGVLLSRRCVVTLSSLCRRCVGAVSSLSLLCRLSLPSLCHRER